MKSIFFQADKKLLEITKSTVKHPEIANVYFGRKITGEYFVEDNHRDELNEKFSPLCVDMETASVAQTCYVNNIPFIAVRTVTDTAEHCGSKEFHNNCSKASEISANIVRILLKELCNEYNR
ncbi:MAG: 5'-methylthioadenosine/S-adenosylhomocysteine nucleosidase [Erysipelotrichaceae bacterium]